MLTRLKLGKFSADDIFAFQPVLCESLMRLDRGYRRVLKEERRLISRKKWLKIRWFERRMQLLRQYRDSILGTMSVGRTLGDCFAWFFYQKEQGYLRDHAKLQLQSHLPPGIGGLGELEFVKNVRALSGKLLIYHGTTTILRNGDVSFIDLNTMKVAGLGELKTVQTAPNELSICVTWIGPHKLDLGTVKTVRPSKGTDQPKMSPMQERRLRKQIASMTSAVQRQTGFSPDISLHVAAGSRYREFEELVKQARSGRLRCRQVGEALLLGVYKYNSRSLFRRALEFGTSRLDSGLSDIPMHTAKIIAQGSANNHLFVISLLYTDTRNIPLLPGMIPLFWLPIDSDVVRAVVMKETFVIGVYNPAHLFEALAEHGFKIEYDPSTAEFSVWKPYVKGKMWLAGLPYFFRLVYENLYSEQRVLEMIIRSVSETESLLAKHGVRRARVDLIVQPII